MPKIPPENENGIAIREQRKGYYVVDFQVNNKRVRKGFADLEKARVSCRENRVTMVGGTFSVESAPGKGTVVSAQIPFRCESKPQPRERSPDECPMERQAPHPG